MDIMNELPDARFDAIDDLLAFVSIYDDENRTRAYFDLLQAHADDIRGQVCLEAGCGFGLMAEFMAKLGAKKVYAVEANRHLYAIARERLAGYANVEVVRQDLRDFVPPELVHLLVHEFFGQLLFDEDIHVLEQLSFTPDIILPNKALLKMSALNAADFTDEVVSANVLQKVSGALVSGLFEDEGIQPEQTIMVWQPGAKKLSATVHLPPDAGDLLCFGLEIYHDDQFVCRAGECDNWSLVWTPRAGDRFTLKFKPGHRGASVYFSWSREEF